MENSVTPEKKQSILKSLAIAGLLGITIFIAWLSIQIVQVFPAALTSLVSVANSVYNYNPLETPNIAITSQSTLVNTGEAFLVSWETPQINGTYTFRYPCTDGVSVSLTTTDKNFVDVDCATEYDLGNNDSVTLFINTNRERFTTVPYTISFYQPNSVGAATKTEETVTIVNASISSSTLATDENLTGTTTPESVSSGGEVTNPELPAKPVEPVAATPTGPKENPAPQPSTPAYTYTYAIPTSNPTGTADLAVSISGLGYLDSKNNFIETDSIEYGRAGAIQFIVHNLGDRTSSDWSYIATLPGGEVYQSEEEKPLRPNERAVLTISYDAVTISYSERVSMSVMSDLERTENNNTVGTTRIVKK